MPIGRVRIVPPPEHGPGAGDGDLVSTIVILPSYDPNHMDARLMIEKLR
jgi:hypothetical protein